MQEPQLKDNNRKLQLPSIHQFYALSLLNYTQLTLKKIQMHLASNQTVQESAIPLQNHLQTIKYHKLSNEELKRRSSFLLIVYQLMTVYGQFVSEMNPKTYDQLSKINSCIELPLWLQQLRLGNDQLSKLTRLKKGSQEETKVEFFNRKLITMLFETQIYIYQILIRLIILQIIYSENQKYSNQLKQLKNKYRFHHLGSQKVDNKQGRQINLRPMRKSSQSKCKELFRQINKIITFYQLEVSTNRQDCRVKPQLQYLLELIEEKFSKDFKVEMMRKTELGNLSLQIKQTKKNNIFAPFILIPLSSESIGENNFEKNNGELQEDLNNQKSSKMDAVFKEFQSQQFVSANNQEQSIEIEIIQSQNQGHSSQKQQPKKPSNHNNLYDKTAESARVMLPESSNSEKSKSKFQGETVLSSYLKQKSKKHRYYTTKLSNYSHYKKLQYISNNQRFSSRCNLQNKLVKSKRQHSESQSPFSEQIRQYNDRVKKQSLAKQHRALHRHDLASLAEQTPHQRRLPFYQKKEND